MYLLIFLFLLSILSVVLLLLTKLTSSFTLFFPIFFLYLFCPPANLLGLSATRVTEKQVTHKVTNSLTSSGLCLLVPGVLSFPPFPLFLALVRLLSCS